MKAWIEGFASAIVSVFVGIVTGTALYFAASVAWQHWYCGQAWRDCKPSLIACEPIKKAQAEWDELQARARKQGPITSGNQQEVSKQ